MNFLTNKNKVTKLFQTKAAKLGFFVLFFCILYFQLRAKGNWSEMWLEFQNHFGGTSFTFLVGALCLVFFNIFTEVIKWRFLVRPFQKINMVTASQAVLSGLSLALVTPARIGEFGGRMLGLESSNRPKGVWALAFGSFIQTVLIFCLGWLALRQHPEWISNPYISVPVLLNILFLVGLILIVVVLKHDYIINRILRKRSKISKWIHQGYFKYNLRQTGIVAGLAIFRFGIYSFQFYLLNRFFGIDIDLQTQFAVIFAIFLFQAFFPLPAMLGLLMKSEIALFLWSSYGVNEISILSGTFFLWIINVLLPGLFGLFYLKKIFSNKT